jgi:hypothetical protein
MKTVDVPMHAFIDDEFLQVPLLVRRL